MRPDGSKASSYNELIGKGSNNKTTSNSKLAITPLLFTHSKHDPSLNLIETRYMGHSFSEFFAGYCAACTSITLLFPLNKCIFRQMLGSISFKEAFMQIKSEGLANFYRGLLPPLLQKSTSYSIMFGTQNEYYWMLKGKKSTKE